jgi:sulfur carrier protein
VITLHINGQPRQLPASLSITELMIELDLVGKRVAVERNGEIVPRSQHGDARVVDGDQLEIVVAVGGG